MAFWLCASVVGADWDTMEGMSEDLSSRLVAMASRSQMRPVPEEILEEVGSGVLMDRPPTMNVPLLDVVQMLQAADPKKRSMGLWLLGGTLATALGWVFGVAIPGFVTNEALDKELSPVSDKIDDFDGRLQKVEEGVSRLLERQDASDRLAAARARQERHHLQYAEELAEWEAIDGKSRGPRPQKSTSYLEAELALAELEDFR